MKTFQLLAIPPLILLFIVAIYQQYRLMIKISELESSDLAARNQLVIERQYNSQKIDELQNSIVKLNERISNISIADGNDNRLEAEQSKGNSAIAGQGGGNTQQGSSQSPYAIGLPPEITEIDAELLHSLELRGNQLVERVSPENALLHLAVLTEENLNKYMDAVAINMARQEDYGRVPSRLSALIESRDLLSEHMSESQLTVIDNYIDVYESEQDEINDLEQTLLRQVINQ